MVRIMVGFSKAIREQVLVDAARHCSVCHRFKAIGVEVHHIMPRSEGGLDTEDNAIALCLDCHLAAGHYNPKHPKGKKYSPEELQKHKAAWIQTVAHGSIQVPVSADELSVIFRHVVTSDRLAIENVLALNHERLPFGQFFLLEALPILIHIRECFLQEALFTSYVDRRSYTGLLSPSVYDRYETVEMFHKAHPEFAGAEIRELKKEDAEFIKLQPVWQRAIEEGADPAALGRICAIGGPVCGDGWWHQEALFRVPHGVFMHVQNMNKYPIKLQTIAGTSTGDMDKVDFRLLVTDCKTCESQKLLLPSISIPSMGSLLIPEGVFYGPLEDSWFESSSSEEYGGSVDTGEVRVQSFVFDPSKLGPFFATGPWLHIDSVEAILDGGSRIIPTHCFDPRKPFVSIDNVWFCGSCPHVFWQATDGQWFYGGEIIVSAKSAESAVETSCVVPCGISKLRIWELEYEETTIDWISVDGSRVAESLCLNRGESFEISVLPGQSVTIRGYYSAPIVTGDGHLYAVQKYRCIASAITSLNAVRAVGNLGHLWEFSPIQTRASLSP